MQRIDDCISITAVAVKDSVSDTTYTAWAASDYIAFNGDRRNPEFNQTPYNALMVDVTGDQSHFTSGWQGGGSYQDVIFSSPIYGNFRVNYNPRQTHGLPTVQITARWGGYATVPDIIKQATISQCSRWYKRGQSSWDDTLASAELGNLIFALELDPDIKQMLTYYRRPSAGRK